LDARATADQERNYASIFMGCVSAYNHALEASNKNKEKIAEYKVQIAQMQALDAPNEQLMLLMDLMWSCRKLQLP
jgi:hypothetical protein